MGKDLGKGLDRKTVKASRVSKKEIKTKNGVIITLDYENHESFLMIQDGSNINVLNHEHARVLRKALSNVERHTYDHDFEDDDDE
jgi:hypothetical protein